MLRLRCGREYAIAHRFLQEDGAAVDLDSQRQGKCVVLKTSTRQTIFLPVVGLVDADKLKPGDLVGVNKDSYLILDTLPAEYDSRVKAMEVCCHVRSNHSVWLDWHLRHGPQSTLDDVSDMACRHGKFSARMTLKSHI